MALKQNQQRQHEEEQWRHATQEQNLGGNKINDAQDIWEWGTGNVREQRACQLER